MKLKQESNKTNEIIIHTQFALKSASLTRKKFPLQHTRQYNKTHGQCGYTYLANSQCIGLAQIWNCPLHELTTLSEQFQIRTIDLLCIN